MNMIVSIWLLAAGGIPASSNGPAVARFAASQPHMGTKFTIVVYAPGEGPAARAFEIAFARIARLDQMLSDYRTTSELSRLSRSSPTSKPVAISADLWHVLAQSQHLAVRSKGAFDVTVGPLTKLWRRARRQRRLPTERRLAAARAAVGFRYLCLDEGQRTAQLLQPDMRLDLGGIAKGYAVDQALNELRRLGLCRALVDAGGDLAVGDPPPGRPGWRIGIAPLEPAAHVAAAASAAGSCCQHSAAAAQLATHQDPPYVYATVVRRAVATSGDMFQYVIVDGVRYSHIVDPRTGLGLTRRSSVTVVAADCTTADALASVVSVLGPEQGLELVAEYDGVEARVLSKKKDQIVSHDSPGFRAWVSPN